MEKPNSLNSLISPEAFVTLSFWKRVAEQNQLKFIVHLSLMELIEQLLESQTGCWYTYPSEKYDFVSWNDDIPNLWERKKNYSKPPAKLININIGFPWFPYEFPIYYQPAKIWDFPQKKAQPMDLLPHAFVTSLLEGDFASDGPCPKARPNAKPWSKGKK